MTYRVEITSLAEKEYAAAFLFYQEKQSILGDKFEMETEAILEKLKSNPHLFQRKYKHYREAIIKHFPYFIIYEIIGTSVIVHSFFHTSRNPKGKPKKKR